MGIIITDRKKTSKGIVRYSATKHIANAAAALERKGHGRKATVKKLKDKYAIYSYRK